MGVRQGKIEDFLRILGYNPDILILTEDRLGAYSLSYLVEKTIGEIIPVTLQEEFKKYDEDIKKEAK